MKKIIDFYKYILGFEEFYNIALHNSITDQKEFIQCYGFLNGVIKHDQYSPSNTKIKVKTGDYRIDVPVWFGDILSAKNRIIIFGLEPRDTNSDFNIEQVGNKIFGTPFGIDRWNEFSTVKRKPQNRYFRVFKELIHNKNNFVLFSDIVKDYQIVSETNEGGQNDLNARKIFLSKAESQLEIINEEINIISPTHIITLGNNSFDFLNKYFPGITFRLRHPANGGEVIAKNQLKNLINYPNL